MHMQSIECAKLHLTKLLTIFYNFLQKIVNKNRVPQLRKFKKHFKCEKSKKKFFLH